MQKVPRVYSSVCVFVRVVGSICVCKCVGLCVFLCMCMYTGLSNYKQETCQSVIIVCVRLCVCLLSVCMVLKKLTYFERKEDVVP